MTETALSAALHRRHTGRPPVWFMRQAGRYHSHYQSLKRYADFIALCKEPQLAAETAMGPVHDFNFDAAILFSDLLFPLEAMGMGLTYAPGPKLAFHLKTPADLARLQGGAEKAAFMQFQAEAMKLTRARLRSDKGLIGFVGGPFTLYVYAAAGSHEKAPEALPGLSNGLYEGFNEKLLDLLAHNMLLQSQAGAEVIAVMDTAAGEIDAETYGSKVVPVLADLLARFRKLDPVTPILYYSRGTGPAHWDKLAGLPIAALGIDWRHDMAEVLAKYGDRYAIQGNFDPEHLLLPTEQLEPLIRTFLSKMKALPAEARKGWICGLGHGVLQKTPEAHVKLFLRLQREYLRVTQADVALLRKYNVPGPRYTSYPTVPYWDRTPTEAEWIDRIANAVASDADGAGAALYLHIPFCRSLCTYCGCNMRVTRNHGLVMPYVQALINEYSLYLQRLGRESLNVGEIHLGGGTPTFLHPEELDALLSGLLSRSTVTKNASLSIEVDPRTTTHEQLVVLQRHGFNRISLGVQDFDPRVQDIVNRLQSEEQVRTVTEDARALGFRSVNFDLIYGLPLQTLDSITATMDAVVRLKPDRIAFYAYAHVPWIKPSQRRFTEADLPEGDAKRALYELGRARLEAAGYVEIGMDHFALATDDLVIAARQGRLHRNFMGYTPAFSRPLLGLGVSSIGDAGDAFAQNEKNLQQYEERIAKGELPIQRGHLLDAEDVVLRGHILDLMTGLETRWTASDRYTPFLDSVPERLAEMQKDGLLDVIRQHGETRIHVAPAGRAFLRNVCMAFDARLIRKAPATQLFSSTV